MKLEMMYEILINLGTAIGIAVYVFLAYRYFKNWRIVLGSTLIILVLFIVSNPFGQFVKRLTYWDWSNFNEFIAELKEYGGNHFLGRVLFVSVTAPVCLKLLKKQDAKTDKVVISQCLDILSFVIVIQHFFNRAACYTAGCCYGKPYHGFGAVKFTWGTAFNLGVTYPVYPTQLFEMFGMVLLLGIIIVGFIKKKHIFNLTIIGFGVIIFISEFFMNQTGMIQILGFTWIQIFAAILFLLGIIRYSIHKRMINHK